MGRWALPTQARAGPVRGVGPPPSVPGAEVTTADALANPSAVAPSPLYELLRNNSSSQALRPADEGLLRAYCGAVSHALESGVPRSSKDKDRRAWQRWTDFLAGGHHNSCPLRDDAPEHYAREALLVASFIIYLSGKLMSSIKGRTYCKPATYMGYVYSVKRIHVRHFKLFQAIGPARGIIKALNGEYVLREGPECLIPARKEPISRGMVRAMLAVVDGASLPGAGILQWQSWRGVTLRALLCTAAPGGFRKAELGLPSYISKRNSRFDFYFLGT